VEITLVRHAESESNVTGRWQGQGDAQLSSEGRRQARALGERLAGERFDVVLCSDLSRCCDTAEALGLPIERVRAWREVDVGRWEGLTRAEVAERFPDEVARLREGAQDVAIGGGESWMDLHARIEAAFGELRARLEPGARALVITHGGVIHGLLSGLLGLRDQRPRPIGRVSNTGISTVRFDGDAMTLVRYNDSGHLGPIGQWVGCRTGADRVVTLVAHGRGEDDVPASNTYEGAGRSRGHRAMIALEKLASWYPPLHTVYAGAAPELRNAAAVMAARKGASLSDDALEPDALPSFLAALPERSETRPRGRLAVVATAAQVATAVTQVVGGRARVAPPAHASITHVVTTPHGRTLGDYNVALHGGAR
jgi:broad specificity phosphatase PhoE